MTDKIILQDCWINAEPEKITGEDVIIKIEVPKEGRTAWLVRHTDKIIMSKEEFEKAIKEAWTDGWCAGNNKKNEMIIEPNNEQGSELFDKPFFPNM